jgi:hypothetical protein
MVVALLLIFCSEILGNKLQVLCVVTASWLGSGGRERNGFVPVVVFVEELMPGGRRRGNNRLIG